MRHARNVTLVLLALGALAFAWLALGPSPRAGTPAAGIGDPPPVKVAFIGDQGLGPNSVAVLQLIQNEGSDLVIHSGDFDYANDPGAWDAQITGVLGASFPYLASIGNHDDCCIAAYAAKVQARVDANSEITCVIATGETVISGSTCTFRGLYIVFTGPDVTGAGDTVYAPYIAGQLAATNAAWRICSWHKNQRLMQVGGKEDQAGGLVWRWKDGDNYYVARANALEDNVSLYYTQNGSRKTLQYVDAPVARNAWHTLRVEFSGRRIRVILDGRACIEMDDDHIPGAGAVGVWTKADSVTAFDDFSYGATPSP